MSWVTENLLPNERIMFRARIHPAIYMPTLVLIGGSAILCGAGLAWQKQWDFGFLCLVFPAALFLLLGLLDGIDAFITVATTEFAVTNQRVMGKRGLIRRHTLEILLPKVESVSVHQNLVGRVFGFGTVIVSGTGGTRERFGGIAEPVETRRRINLVLQQLQGPSEAAPQLSAAV